MIEWTKLSVIVALLHLYFLDNFCECGSFVTVNSSPSTHVSSKAFHGIGVMLPARNRVYYYEKYEQIDGFPGRNSTLSDITDAVRTQRYQNESENISLSSKEEEVLSKPNSYDNFGDIMTTPLINFDGFTTKPDLRKKSVQKKGHSGLVTKAAKGIKLSEQFAMEPPLSAMDRVILTANGNLQRIISSYYDAPVTVHVKSCVERSHPINVDKVPMKSTGVWDRSVEIKVSDVSFCVAISEITVHEPNCAHLVRSGEVGIGQLFRYLDKLPTFDLINAGRTSEGQLWRLYELESEELTCTIFEKFSPDIWSIECI